MIVRNWIGSIIVAMALSPLAAFASGGSDVEAEGVLSAISASSATVAGVTFILNSSTKYEDSMSNHISRSDFSVGDRVEAKGDRISGLNIATKLELKSEAASPSSSPNPSSTPKLGDDNGKNKGKKSNDSSKNSSKEKLRAKLRDSEGVVTSAHGKLEYRNRSDKNRKEFKINVEMPLPNDVPAIVDLADAADENLTVDLLRGGNPYATCYLDLDDNSDDSIDDSLEAEFKVKIELRKGKLRVKRGACDTDLLQAGVDSGLPAVQIGDVIVVKDSLGAEFLRGTVK